MKKILFTFIFLVQSLIGFSQFTDDFSDGDFTNNPKWIGDVGRFEIDTNFELHLNDSITNTSFLSTTSQAIISGVWEFEVNMEFDPSGSNYSKVFLTSDVQDLGANLNGYFVRVGGQSLNLDDISLYAKSGNTETKIIDGTDGLAASNPDLKVKVTRDILGNWELFLDTTGTYFSEGVAFDTTHISSDYFGVYCKYTSTRANKIWFDNFIVTGSFISDTIKPVVLSTSISSSNSVLVEFSENIDSVSAINMNNYFIDNGIGNPNLINTINPKSVEIIFANSFVSPNNYQLSIHNVKDLEQNVMLPFDITFAYFIVEENDIIINEIFVDPTQLIGLPEVEYIELYNTTNFTIDLTNWIITIGTSDKVFPTAVVEPDSFVVLIKEDSIGSFPNNMSKIGLSAVSLTNTGSDLVLKNADGKTINTISYTDKWYNDDNKSDGGWSIERVNPNLFCERENNWKASVANIGGTPGKQNSVMGEEVLMKPFRITKAFIIDSNKVQVHFNKSLDSLSLLDGSLFSINGIPATKSTPLAPFFNSLNLTFGFTFLENNTYTVSANGLIDCSGNLISNSMDFGIADSAKEHEIIINEVLFNPKEGGVDYVEIYNNSSFFFDLSKLNIAEFIVLGNYIDSRNPKIITEDPLLIAPKTYLVLTTDTAKVKSQYYCENPYAFIEIASMPAMSNDTGTICIVHQSLNQIIDAFAYSENMHFSLLESVDGVSLERLSFNDETQKNSNWHSAASTVGFGTPSYKNSQEFISQSVGEISIDPKSFSPNNDGYKDVCSINWDFSKTNLMATIKIFDSKGRLVKNSLNNKMIGNSGSTSWDGTSEEGLQLNTGIYIVWMEIFSESGNVEQFKEIVVLSR